MYLVDSVQAVHRVPKYILCVVGILCTFWYSIIYSSRGCTAVPVPGEMSLRAAAMNERLARGLVNVRITTPVMTLRKEETLCRRKRHRKDTCSQTLE